MNIQQMFKSWKTGLAGVVVMGSWLASQGIISQNYANAIDKIAVGIGLILAKDADKSHTQ